MPRPIEIPEPVGSLIGTMMIALKTTDQRVKAMISGKLKNTAPRVKPAEPNLLENKV